MYSDVLIYICSSTSVPPPLHASFSLPPSPPHTSPSALLSPSPFPFPPIRLPYFCSSRHPSPFLPLPTSSYPFLPLPPSSIRPPSTLFLSPRSPLLSLSSAPPLSSPLSSPPSTCLELTMNTFCIIVHGGMFR